MTNTPQTAADATAASANLGANNVSAGMTETLKRMHDNSDRLETVLDQTVQALKKRGFQLATDLGGMVRVIQQDITQVQKSAQEIAGKQNQLEQLVRILGLINSSLDVDQVLQDVMDTVIKLTGAERAYLMLTHEDSDELTIRAARNWGQETLSQDDVVFSRSVINSAVSSRQPVLTTNAQADERFQGMQSVFDHALRSIVCIPLVRRDKVIGVLYADNRIGHGIFSQESLPLLGAFAIQAATAIENARTYTQVKTDLNTAQRELQTLKIQLDQQKMQEQIGEITESEYFQKLQGMVSNLRQRKPRRAAGEESPAVQG